MRRLIVTCLLLLSFFTKVVAMEVDISLSYRTEQKDSHDNRRFSLLLSASYDDSDNSIGIYSNVSVESVSVVLRDENGLIVYVGMDTSLSKCHIFYLNALASSSYVLEVNVGDEVFYGEFTVSSE